MGYNTKIMSAKQNTDILDLQKLEEKYGFKFPDDIVTHYLAYNGGYPEKPLFVHGDSEYVVNCFLPVRNEDIKGRHLGETLRLVRDVLPKGLIPFADDDGGNLFCFSSRSDDFGAIYYFDHEFDYGDNVNNYVIYLADSITTFINSLEVYDDEDI